MNCSKCGRSFENLIQKCPYCGYFIDNLSFAKKLVEENRINEARLMLK